MKYKRITAKVTVLCILTSLCACGGKQTDKQQMEEALPLTSNEPVIIETNHLNPGVKEVEIRVSDPANQPIILDFTANLPTQPFSLKDYFSKATCVTLRHPLPEDQGGFLYDASIVVSYDQGMSSSRGVNTSVQLCDNHILTSDLFASLCFDQAGQLTDSFVIAHIDGLKYNIETQEIEFHARNRRGTIGNTALESGHKYRYMERDTVNNYNKMVWKSLEDGRLLEEIRFIEQGHTANLFALGDSTLISIAGNFMLPEILTTFNRNTYDTLCVFSNYNLPTGKLSGSYAFPERTWNYQNKDKFYFRQAFNDTIFSLAAANRLLPEYVLRLGHDRMTIDDALYGDKSQKYMAYSWIDTESFILFTYSKNYDCPNTRNENSVHYSYALYDKTKKQLSLLPADNMYPEEYLLPAEVPNGIPVIVGELVWQDNKLVSTYTKRKLQALQKMKNFTKLSTQQQERIRQLAESLAENEMVVMTLE